MRADIVVNLLTLRALQDGVMRLMTPELSRPHCHVQDAASLYLWLLERPYITGTYNAGFENQTIRETAQLIARYTGVAIEETASSMGKRSYRVDSSKIWHMGFKPQYSVAKAIEEMVDMWKAGALVEDETMTNLAHMRRQGLVRE
jgi:nucleoside-diphosphate-sugar epimerase